jgi:Lectin C-type domain
MLRLRSGTHALRVGAGIVVIGVAACGNAQDTPFYNLPLPPSGSASSGALTNSGGDTSSGSGGMPSAAAGSSAASGTGGAFGGTAGAEAATGGVLAAGGGDGNAPGASGSAGTLPSVGDGGASGDGTTGAAGAGGEVPVVDCSPHGALAQGFDGHCYALSDSDATFTSAVADCQSRGAHLVTISSEGRTVAQFLAENAFVWQLAGSAETWIGATDGKGPHQPGDGTYSEWITGEPMTYDNWSSGQPNNAQSSCQEGIPCSCDKGACYEHCGFLWDTPGNQMDAVPGWNDRVCDHVLSYVCEWDE